MDDFIKALIEDGKRQEIKRDAKRFREHIRKVQEELNTKLSQDIEK